MLGDEPDNNLHQYVPGLGEALKQCSKDQLPGALEAGLAMRLALCESTRGRMSLEAGTIQHVTLIML
jgi:hypothetical protein